MSGTMSSSSGDTSNGAPSCRVSVVIKALNEEKRIACAIETALQAVAPLGGEVILADSCSSDRTIEIASQYPITIAKLANASERCCGIGPQLGYQHARGDYVYILDGDMELRPAFLAEAVQFLDAHPRVGGVGGQVVEHNTDSLEYLARVERNTAHMGAGPVDRLDMGGLYRRSAIEQIGYFSNRNLHSYEELDLAARLRSHGWELQRIATPSVDHHGHSVSPYVLLGKRWKSGYIKGSGEVVRAALGQPHLKPLLNSLREAKLYAVVTTWLLLGALAAVSTGVMLGTWAAAAGVAALTLLMPFGALLARKRSMDRAVYAYASLLAHCAGFVRGLLSPQSNPRAHVASTLLDKTS